MIGSQNIEGSNKYLRFLYRYQQFLTWILITIWVYLVHHERTCFTCLFSSVHDEINMEKIGEQIL